MSKVAIQAEHVNLFFGDKQALFDVSWRVGTGEIATLIGPNGCGKSTLLRAMTGNLPFQQGKVHVASEELGKVTAKELAKQVAFLPQTPELPRDMLVEELVYCGRFPHQNWWKNTAEEDRIAVDRALQVTKTEGLRHRVVASLSGGERQRVWIAMALAQEPKILILDEPTTYLDINHQLEVLELLQRLNREEGLTVLMVLHELNQAAQYSDRVAVMEKGHLVMEGTPKEVFTEQLLADVFHVKAKVEDEERMYVRIDGLCAK